MIRNVQKGWLARLKGSWASLSQAGVWILGIVCSFLLPHPSGLSSGDEKIWQSLAKFIVTFLVGLLFIVARRSDKKRHLRGWTTVAALLLVFAVADFLVYQSFLYSRTCTYNALRVVKGSVYTPHGLDYVQKNPGISCQDLFEDHAGNAEDIWTAESIGHNRMVLAEVYVGCLPLFAACIIAILQAVALARP